MPSGGLATARRVKCSGPCTDKDAPAKEATSPGYDPCTQPLCLLTLCLLKIMCYTVTFPSSKKYPVSNMFILSLAAADLTVGGIVMPISSVYAITGRWVLGLVVCQFWLSADYTASTASIFNLFILSVDRYWSITSPLRYLRKRTKKRALIMIGLVWAVSALWILPIIGWHHLGHGRRAYPPSVCETEFAGNVVFKVTAAIINFYFPSLLMVYLYGRIFFEIKKRSRFEIGQCNHSRMHSVDNEDSLAEERYQAAATAGRSAGASGSMAGDEGSKNNGLGGNQRGRPFKRWSATQHSVQRFNERNPMVTLSEGSRQPSTHNGEISQLLQFRNLTLLSYREEGTLVGHVPRHEVMSHFEGVTVNVEYVMSSTPEVMSSPGGPPPPAPPPSPPQPPPPIRNWTTRSSSGAGPRLIRSRNQTITRHIRGKNSRKRGGRDTITLQKEKKAARQLGVIMGAFMLCWLPYFVLFMVIAFCEDCVHPKIHTATIWLGYVNSTLNPILYPLCNANFKRAFRRMLGLNR
ncbi:5-hydroxytryptamine receptor 1B-like [Ischnura elegans]|uniref:5-hydroxytryptamine receptor 1B-like n=1 Tax=Ischnura elegans TaxID=197161 RepID=UPI001ED86BC8|nr:5-hydroxytryptamine receptor 1B-like [Ischnura elegans]